MDKFILPANYNKYKQLRDRTGIYRIRFEGSSKCYIGSTSSSFMARRKGHLVHMKRGEHHNIVLIRAYNKYGRKAFIFEIMCLCEPSECMAKEQEFIDAHDFKKDLYNISPIAEGSRNGNSFTKDEIIDIFRMRASGMTINRIHERLGVGKQCIDHILLRKTYKDMAVPDDLLEAAQGMNLSVKISDREDVIKMISMRSSGMSLPEIGEKFGVSYSSASYSIGRFQPENSIESLMKSDAMAFDSNKARTISDEDLDRMRSMKESGMTVVDIADFFGVHKRSVFRRLSKTPRKKYPRRVVDNA